MARDVFRSVAASEAILDTARLMQASSGSEILEKFQMFRGVVSLAIHRASRRKLAVLPSFEACLQMLGGTQTAHTSFDRLSLAQRAELIEFFWPLLDQWPNPFLEMAQRAGVRLVDFSPVLNELPQAMLSVVELHLGRPSRSITAAAVESAVQHLASSGKKVNRESVGRLVGSRFSPRLNHLRPREVSREEERELLVQGLENYVRTCSSKRKSSKMVRCRNALAVGIAILKRCSLQEAITVSWAEMRLEVAGPPGDCENTSRLRQLLADLLSDYVGSTRADARMQVGPVFVPFRARGGGTRGPTQALRAAMDGLDERLRRAVNVFWS